MPMAPVSSVVSDSELDYARDMSEAKSIADDRFREEYYDMVAQDEFQAESDELMMRLGFPTHARVEQVTKRFSVRAEDEVTRGAVETLFSAAKVDVKSDADWIGEPDYLFVPAGLPAAYMQPEGDCFSVLCSQLGVSVEAGCDTPFHLSAAQLASLRAASVGKMVLLVRRGGALIHGDNHVRLVDDVCPSDSAGVVCRAAGGGPPLLVSVVSAGTLFSKQSILFYLSYFSQSGAADDPAGFGSLAGVRGADRPGRGGYAAGGRDTEDVESVVEHGLGSGGSNVSGNAVRRTGRKLRAVAHSVSTASVVARNYSVASGVMFNNLQEMTLDAISPDYAQEILEEIFAAWGVDFASPEVMKYAEDLVCTFLVASTASDKADYNRSFDVPGRPGKPDIVADFKMFSDIIVIQHRLTRRQFARGFADRLRSFVRAEQNGPLQAGLADRAGSQMQFGDLCFDGSTHCAGLTPSEKAFVKVLEARNLFEVDSVMASGASDKLLTGFNQRQAPRVTG